MQAHQHVQNSEEYEAQGLLIPAADEHRKAAEAFQLCIEQSTDEQVRPLQILSARSN